MRSHLALFCEAARPLPSTFPNPTASPSTWPAKRLCLLPAPPAAPIPQPCDHHSLPRETQPRLFLFDSRQFSPHATPPWFSTLFFSQKKIFSHPRNYSAFESLQTWSWPLLCRAWALQIRSRSFSRHNACPPKAHCCCSSFIPPQHGQPHHNLHRLPAQPPSTWAPAFPSTPTAAFPFRRQFSAIHLEPALPHLAT